MLYNDGSYAVLYKERGLGTRGHHPGSLECALKWIFAAPETPLQPCSVPLHVLAALEKRVAGESLVFLNRHVVP